MTRQERHIHLHHRKRRYNLNNAWETLAASVESGASSKVSRTMLEDCETDDPTEDAQPPQKKLNVMTDAKDADINELAMTDLSQSQNDPGMFTLVVLWRGITRNDRGSPGCSCRRGVTRPHSCSLAWYGRQTKSVVLCISEKKIAPPSEPQGLTRELRPPHPLLIPSLRRTHGSETSKEPWVP